MSFWFIHSRTAAMRPLSIKRASKTDQVTVLEYTDSIITLHPMMIYIMLLITNITLSRCSFV